MSGPPDDVTLGELWRGQQSQREALAALTDEVRQLPHRLSAEVARDVDLRFVTLEQRTRVLERALWGVVAFVFISLGTALMALVLHAPTG